MRAIAFALAVLVFPVFGTASAAPPEGFLPDQDLKDTSWLPPAPTRDGAIDISDMTVYFGTRGLTTGPRGAEAHADDVFVPADVAPRFNDALGVALIAPNPRPNCIAAKAVSDFGDNEKGDDYQEYAARVSSVFTYEFLRRLLKRDT